MTEVLFRQCGAGNQSTAADRAENRVDMQFLAVSIDLYFTHEGGLSGHHERIIKWVQERVSMLLCYLTGSFVSHFLAIAIPVVGQDYSRTRPFSQCDLVRRCVPRHYNRDGDTSLTSRQRESLGKVSGGEGHDASITLLR